MIQAEHMNLLRCSTLCFFLGKMLMGTGTTPGAGMATGAGTGGGMGGTGTGVGMAPPDVGEPVRRRVRPVWQ